MIEYIIKLLLIGFLVIACSKSYSTVTPVWRPITEAVYASGTIRPKGEYKVFALTEGYLSAKKVEVNDSVIVGQPLFTLESTEQTARAKATEQVYRIAKQNYNDNSPVLSELRAVLSTALAKRYNDSLNLARDKRLIDKQALTQVEYERAQLVYKTSNNEYIAARERYLKAKDQLKIDLENAESAYRVNQSQEGYFVVRSATAGLLYEIYREVGEVVRRNEPLALIGNGKNLYLQLAIDELDIGRIRLGQTVLVTADSYNGQIFKARVQKIYPLLSKQEQTFRIDAEFDKQPPASFAGLNVEANIVVHDKEKAMLVPRTAMAAPDSVWVLHDGKPVATHVLIGAQNDEVVEILRGIDSTTMVVIK